MQRDVHGQCGGTTLRRDQLLRRAAVAGSAVLLPLSATGRAEAAAPPDNDLAYVRLLVAAELLAADVQAKARASAKLTRRSKAVLEKMAVDEKGHYAKLAQLLTAAGQPATGPGDIDFSYPKRSFGSQPSILRLAAEIETLVLGAYLGAVENVETAELRLPIGQIAANEAQHVGAVASLRGRAVIGRAFAPALQIDAASAALDRYES
jgi:ferritin-like protein